MKTALIGYSGFVGQNLVRQFEFDELYNSKNIDDIRGRSFDLLVCAGVSAKKWVANANPEADWIAVKKLLDPLNMCESESAVLISTVDVFPVIQGVDESFDCHKADNHAYGVNRLRVEDYFLEKFSDCKIARLPGLFGKGLQKNVIYDLLNDNMLEKINPQSEFQWYSTEWLWGDIEKIRASDARMVTLATEPVATSEILEYFPGKEIGAEMAPLVKYDLKTMYSGLFGRDGDYIRGSNEVLSAMKRYIDSERCAQDDGCV